MRVYKHVMKKMNLRLTTTEHEVLREHHLGLDAVQLWNVFCERQMAQTAVLVERKYSLIR